MQILDKNHFGQKSNFGQKCKFSKKNQIFKQINKFSKYFNKKIQPP